MDDHAYRSIPIHGIEGALIGMSAPSSPTLSTRQMCALVAVKIVGRRER
jgi:hypothetical protein